MSSEDLIEEGLGETRFARIEQGRIVEAEVERAGDPFRAGSVRRARLLRPGYVAVDGIEALIDGVPPGVAEGAELTVEIVREPIPEPGRPRLAKVRVTSSTPFLAPSLAERHPRARRLLAHQSDALEAAGWSELIEEARTGVVAFDGGLLAIVLTPAMTVIDVDGALPPAELAVRGAAAAAAAIRRLGITGSIGIDLPTVADKAVRAAAAAEVDRLLPQPFERTAVNGFGFLQIVRRRQRPSLMERVQGAAVETAALALLRHAERAGPGGKTLTAAPAVIQWLEAHPALLAELGRRTGGAAALHADPALAISAGHVH